MDIDAIMERLVERAAYAVNFARAEEVGGCFRPEDAPQGECADGDCYCQRQCGAVARAALNAAGVREMVEALAAARTSLLSPFPMEDQIIARLGMGRSAVEKVTAVITSLQAPMQKEGEGG